MQRHDIQRSDRPDAGTPKTPAVLLGNEDCVIMLESIRQRVAGLGAPPANGPAPGSPPDYQVIASRMALNECDAALGQLLDMVNPQRGGAEQIVRDVAELRIVLSAAHRRL